MSYHSQVDQLFLRTSFFGRTRRLLSPAAAVTRPALWGLELKSIHLYTKSAFEFQFPNFQSFFVQPFSEMSHKWVLRMVPMNFIFPWLLWQRKNKAKREQLAKMAEELGNDE